MLLNITGGPDLSLFEAQAASEIVTQAATSDVNIIFGTSINEDLGDEVVVTVIATGLDDLDNGSTPRRGSVRQSINQAAKNDQAGDANQSKTDDPFGDWDLRREPRSAAADDQQASFDNVQKKEFDVFESQPHVQDSDDSDDQPPFFKRRRMDN